MGLISSDITLAHIEHRLLSWDRILSSRLIFISVSIWMNISCISIVLNHTGVYLISPIRVRILLIRNGVPLHHTFLEFVYRSQRIKLRILPSNYSLRCVSGILSWIVLSQVLSKLRLFLLLFDSLIFTLKLHVIWENALLLICKV